MTIPKVALLFLAPLGPAHLAFWHAYFEAAGKIGERLDVSGMPPGLPHALSHMASIDLESLVGRPLHPALFPRHARGVLQSLDEPASYTGGTATAAKGASRTDSSPEDESSCLEAKGSWVGQGPGSGPIKEEVQAVDEQARRHAAAGDGPAVYAAQHLFNVYVHTLPGMTVPKGSVFAGREVPHPVDTRDGYRKPVLMQAARLLLATALLDADNIHFLLISDTTIPIIPPGLLWASILSSPKSRVLACDGPWKELSKCPSELVSPFVTPEKHWRKSSQWFVLARSHAALAVADSHVAPMFNYHCYTGPEPGPRCCCSSNSGKAGQVQGLEECPDTPGGRFTVKQPPFSCGASKGCTCMPTNATHTCCNSQTRDFVEGKGKGFFMARDPIEVARGKGQLCKRRRSPCVADEHYFPTLLATYGLEGQCDCESVTVLVDWSRREQGRSHPHTFQPDEFGEELVDKMYSTYEMFGNRKDVSCDWATARTSAAEHLFSAEPVDARQRQQRSLVGAGGERRNNTREARTVSLAPSRGSASLRTVTTSAGQREGKRAAPPLELETMVANWIKSTGFKTSVPPGCPMLARKFTLGRKFVDETLRQQGKPIPLDVALSWDTCAERALLRFALTCTGGLKFGEHCVGKTGGAPLYGL